MKKLYILDSTLRDGAQGEGISFSVQDKLKIVTALDNLGIDYIEAGNPGSNPKDMDFFALMESRLPKHSKLTAFGSTRRKNIKASDDTNLQSLLKANTPCVTIFGKSWDMHVTNILRASLDENLEMIRDTISFLKTQDKEVIYDAEHFFDGFKANPQYALDTLAAAVESGADSICLCDTNGGAFPDTIYEVTKLVIDKFVIPVGIHTHDDGGMAIANSIMAVKAGATNIQGTLAGFGERCGNANLSAVIGGLQTKAHFECIPTKNLIKLTETVRIIGEIANVTLSSNMPYVGIAAFAHKGGMHVDGVTKDPRSFEHIAPETVGNERRILMSEIAGKSALVEKVRKFLPNIERNSPEASRMVSIVKQMEHEGYQFEGAEGSFELLVLKLAGVYTPHFNIEQLKVIDDQCMDSISHSNPSVDSLSSKAMIKVRVGDQSEITAAEGDGPVNAIDKALRKALEIFFPQIAEIRLADYKVRVLDSQSATAARVRVLIETTDGHDYWTTMGVSTDIIKASSIALIDSIEYKLLKHKN